MTTNFEFFENDFNELINDAKSKGIKKSSANVGENTASSLETSKEVQKISLSESEKVIFNTLTKWLNENAPLIFKDFAPSVFKSILLGEIRKLLKVGARESAATLLETFIYDNFIPCNGITIDTIRKERIKVQTRRKAEKVERDAKAQADKIQQLATKFGLTFELAKSMYKAGALKI